MLDLAGQLHDAGRPLLLSNNENKKREESSLLRTLVAFRFTETGDPRDKIYSLLSIINPHGGSKIPVDYTMPWQKVYQNVAVHLLEGTRSLRFLTYGGLNENGLPTWVPDWTAPVADTIVSRNWSSTFHHCETVAGEILVLEECSASSDLNVAQSQCIQYTGSHIRIPALPVAVISTVIAAEAVPSHPSGILSALTKRVRLIKTLYDPNDSDAAWLLSFKYFTYTLGLVIVNSWAHLVTSILHSPRLNNFLELCLPGFRDPASFRLNEHIISDDARVLLDLLRHGMHLRAFFTFHTPKAWGAAGWSPPEDFGCCRVPVRTGDRLFVVPDCPFPMIMRLVRAEENMYQLIGAVYSSLA